MNLVCAEIPDEKENSRLFEIVKRCMIHGPCGNGFNDKAACMENKKFSKEYPKAFCDKTVFNVKGFPLYHRRANKRVIKLPNGKEVDNRCVVPYNPTLSLRYDCHIKVEVCSSIKSVKYLYKYIYKVNDAANLIMSESVQNQKLDWDEIKTYAEGRYVGSPEGCLKLFQSKMHGKSVTCFT